MTPTFSRIWLVNTQSVLARLRLPASLRIAWLIMRAWRPTVWSPIAPSSPAFGRSAATESLDLSECAVQRGVAGLRRLLVFLFRIHVRAPRSLRDAPHSTGGIGRYLHPFAPLSQRLCNNSFAVVVHRKKQRNK